MYVCVWQYCCCLLGWGSWGGWGSLWNSSLALSYKGMGLKYAIRGQKRGQSSKKGSTERWLNSAVSCTVHTTIEIQQHPPRCCKQSINNYGGPLWRLRGWSSPHYFWMKKGLRMTTNTSVGLSCLKQNFFLNPWYSSQSASIRQFGTYCSNTFLCVYADYRNGDENVYNLVFSN